MLTSADVMTADVVSVEPDTPVRDIAQLLYTRRISGVPVVEQGRLIGIVSRGDLIGHAAAIGEQRRSWWLSAFMDDSLSARDYAKTHGRTARDVMTSNVVTVEETTTLAEIAKNTRTPSDQARTCSSQRHTRWHCDTRQLTPGPCDS
jgi:FOG: CBS domain